MFQFGGYNVVHSMTDEIYVDLDNVYIPPIVIKNPSLVPMFEKLWMQNFESRIMAMIRAFWREELSKVPHIINTKHGRYLFDRLIRRDVPPHVLQDYTVRKTDNYCFVKENYNPNFEYHGVYDSKTDKYVPVLEESLKSSVSAGLNRETPEWDRDEFLSSITLLMQHFSYTKWDGINVMGESKYVNMYQLVSVGLDIGNELRYIFSIPEIDFFPKRIKCNGLTLNNKGEVYDCHPCGAKLDKGMWKTTRDKGNNVERSPGYYYNKLINFCEDTSTDRLMDTVLDVQKIGDNLFCISNKGSSFLESSLIINPKKSESLVVAGICEGKVYGIAGADTEEVSQAERFLLSLRLQA